MTDHLHREWLEYEALCLARDPSISEVDRWNFRLAFMAGMHALFAKLPAWVQEAEAAGGQYQDVLDGVAAEFGEFIQLVTTKVMVDKIEGRGGPVQ